MRTTMLARRRDPAGKRTICMFRHAERYHVAVSVRPGQLLPLEGGTYGAYEAAWSRLCAECEPAHEEA